MKKIITLVLVLTSFPLIAHAGYAPETERQMIARGMEGQKLIFARDYPKAMELFKALENEHPDHPIGYFGQMAVLEMTMIEREDFHLAQEFESVAKKGRKAVVKTRGRKPSDWDLLVCGSLLGLEGFYKARQSKWWDAYTLGVKSRQTFKTITRRNPKFADAYFGLGMYLYWRSVYRKKISFLKLFPDKREEGINIVKRVVRDGHFAKDLAEVNLGMMWLEERRYDKAYRVFKKFSDQYPNNVLLHLFVGKTLLAGRKYDGAVAEFREIVALDPSIVQPYYFIGLTRALQKKPEYYDEAQRDLLMFIEKTTRNHWKASGYYWLGRLEELKRDKVKANGYYQKALEYDPDMKKVKLRIRGLGSGI